MKPRWAPEGSNRDSTVSPQGSPKAPWKPLGGPWAPLRRFMLRRLHCQVLPKLESAAGPREAVMSSGRVQSRFSIVPKWVPRSSLKPPGRVLGGLEKRLPKGTKSNPEGTKMASWQAPGGFWAPGLPQMAAQAALRPHVGGSCGPLSGSWTRLGAL